MENLPADAGDIRDAGSVPRSGRSPGGGNDKLLLYSCLKNSMDRGVWWATAFGVTKSQTQLSSNKKLRSRRAGRRNLHENLKRENPCKGKSGSLRV